MPAVAGEEEDFAFDERISQDEGGHRAGQAEPTPVAADFDGTEFVTEAVPVVAPPLDRVRVATFDVADDLSGRGEGDGHVRVGQGRDGRQRPDAGNDRAITSEAADTLVQRQALEKGRGTGAENTHGAGRRGDHALLRDGVL